jgi:hypothetical protein
MSAHFKRTLAALLATASLVAPSVAEAKGDKGGGAKHEAREQSQDNGGETRGGGHKQREERQARPAQQQPAYAPHQSVAFEARGNGEGKRAKRDRPAPTEVFAVADRSEKRQSIRSSRWKHDRHVNVVELERVEPRQTHREGKVVQRASAQDRDGGFEAERKLEKHVAKRQRAAYRAAAKQERRWVKEQRQDLKQAAKVEPVVAYQRSFDDARRSVRYIDAPVYVVPQVGTYRSYPSYGSGYDYAPRYLTSDAYGYAGSYYPQSYSAWPAYSPYDVGYAGSGLGGLFGGGGGLGDILVTLLPLLLGDTLGMGGFATDPLGTGLLGGYATPDFAAGYDPYYQPAMDYAAPVYSEPYQDAYLDQGLLGGDQSLFGSDSLMSLIGLALGSGLLGGDAGGLGGLGGLLGLGGGLGLDGGLGLSDPNYAYANPYAYDGGFLASLGL